MRLVILVTVLLTGCALEPNALRIEGEHVSHISQHFGSDPTNYGYNAVMLEAHWQVGHAFVDLADGINVTAEAPCGVRCYGALLGPREVFEARAGWEIPLK